MSNQTFDVMYYDGVYWHMIQPFVKSWSDARDLAMEHALDFDNTIVKVVNETGSTVIAFKYANNVLYRANDRGWEVNQ